MKFVFNLLFNVRFYVGAVAVIVLMYFFPNISIGSITLPSLPDFHLASKVEKTENHYIPKRQMTNTIIGITYANLTIGQLQHSSQKLIDYDDDFEAMIETKKALQEHLSLDIVALLDNSKNRNTTLTNYLEQLQYYINVSTDVQGAAQTKVVDREAGYASCTTNKEQADAAYLEAINSNDSSSINSLLADAQEYGKCQTDYRIKINSYVLPLQELQTVTEGAQSYYGILDLHFANLVEYYDILRDDVLEDLINTKIEFNL